MKIIRNTIELKGHFQSPFFAMYFFFFLLMQKKLKMEWQYLLSDFVVGIFSVVACNHV